MSTVQDEYRQRRVAELVSELGELARDLTQLCTCADKASVSDVDSLCDTSEAMLQLHVRYAEIYRTLLVMRLRGRGPGS